MLQASNSDGHACVCEREIERFGGGREGRGVSGEGSDMGKMRMIRVRTSI
jgi:hypothetical protein